MTELLAPPSAAALWERFMALPPPLKTMLRLRALIVPPTTKLLFVDCLKASGTPAPDGKAWTAVSITTWSDELRRQDLVTAEYECVPAMLHAVAVDAGASEQAETLVASIRSVLSGTTGNGYSFLMALQFFRESLHRLTRLAVYANDQALFIRNRDVSDYRLAPERTSTTLATIFQNVPTTADWIASRHPDIQAALLNAKLTASITTGATGPEMPDLIALCRARQTEPGFAELAEQLARYDLLTLRLDRLRDTVTDPGQLHADIPRAVEAVIAFLEDRNATALTLFRDALKQRRKRLGRRKLFLPDEYGIVFILALFAGSPLPAARSPSR